MGAEAGRWLNDRRLLMEQELPAAGYLHIGAGAQRGIGFGALPGASCPVGKHDGVAIHGLRPIRHVDGLPVRPLARSGDDILPMRDADRRRETMRASGSMVLS